jgi:cation diffusion facilitator family transporter
MAHNHGHCTHLDEHGTGETRHPHDHGIWTRDHLFLGAGHDRAAARARAATLVTAAFMVVEIACGLLYRSMALLADGIHMATHVGALGLAALAYWLARRHAGSGRFSFGSGKFGDLAAFASALLLGATAIAVAAESVLRLVTPQPAAYRDALAIAVIGLIVNLVSALILRDSHDHGHGHDHHHGHDNNMRAAYVHVLADAATSLLAIAALAGAYYWGLGFLDPLCGLVGAAVIGAWALGLIRDSALVLLDADADPVQTQAIRDLLETEMGARVNDLHLWRLGPGHQGLIVSLVSPAETSAEAIKTALRTRHPGLSHVTVEVAVCADCT